MTIKVDPYDKESIKRAIKAVKQYKKDLEQKTAQLVRAMVQEGLINARDIVPIDTGVARSSITGYVDESTGTGIIRAGGYCSFIEFGTGPVGMTSPHPSPEYMEIMGWAYDVGATIFTRRDGERGWYYPTKDGGWAWTSGMPSRPFMFETAEYLAQEYKRIAREIFSGQGSVQ